jgi:uncharacterized membrane protein YkvA (DUF1232 family)
MRETALKVSFELSPKDVRHFRDQLKAARKSRDADDDASIIQSALAVVKEAEKADPPEFVRVRIAKLERLVGMMTDADWRLEGRDRARVLDALAYFANPDDMIPDRIPGIGYLDDAIMVELIARELTHEIKAYEDFCEFRGDKDESRSSEVLANRRTSLQSRMTRRRRSERQKMRTGAGSSTMRLW